MVAIAAVVSENKRFVACAKILVLAYIFKNCKNVIEILFSLNTLKILIILKNIIKKVASKAGKRK